jgi:tetraacyldisaccharide 4'-kinase
MNLPPVVRLLLWPLSVVYGAVVQLRVWLYARGILKQQRLNTPVISVGNLTVGGTGKTPMVLWLAERFLAEGKRVGILTRGYKGSGGTSDEIELMRYRLKDRVLFGVGKNRYEQGRQLEEKGLDIFLLDDGYQHLPLARDVNILLLDGSRKFQRQWLLPAGELREPISTTLRADMIVVTRRAEHFAVEAHDSHTHSIFYSQTQLLGFRDLERPEEEKYLTEIGPGPFFAFCGIGNPDAFLQDLRRWHVPVCGHKFFRDHHCYQQRDANQLKEAATKRGAAGFVTTEKDWVNLRTLGKLPMPVYVAAISLSIRSESEFNACLERKLKSAGVTA